MKSVIRLYSNSVSSQAATQTDVGYRSQHAITLENLSLKHIDSYLQKHTIPSSTGKHVITDKFTTRGKLGQFQLTHKQICTTAQQVYRN